MRIHFIIKQDKNTPQKDIFLGDSNISNKNYFSSLIRAKGFNILEKQNKLYTDKLLDSEFDIAHKKIEIKIINKKSRKGKEHKALLYTFLNNKKIDSIQFYRNSKITNSPNSYTCLSYFDLKTNKIWQIKYFKSTENKDFKIISYKSNKIKNNGHIENDSLYYLDESLDFEMEKYQLYF